MDYDINHHRRCRYVASISTGDGPSLGPSPFLIVYQVDIPTFDPIHCPGFVPNGDPSLSRGSSLNPFDFSSDSNDHSNNISRVDPSSNPSLDPSRFISTSDGPSFGLGYASLIISSPDSNVCLDNISRVDPTSNPSLDLSPFQIIYSIDVPSIDPSHGPSNALIFSLGFNSPNCVETNNDPSVFSIELSSVNPSLLSND